MYISSGVWTVGDAAPHSGGGPTNGNEMQTSGCTALRRSRWASDNQGMSKPTFWPGAPHPGSFLRPMTRHGLTLVELMVALVIVGIVAAIALPSFNSALYKSRRTDAMAALATMQLAQERYRGNHTSYQKTLADLTGAKSATSPSGYYTMSIGAAGDTSYTLRATAVSSGKQAGDSSCAVFESTLADGSLTYASYSSGGSKNGTPDPCWVK